MFYAKNFGPPGLAHGSLPLTSRARPAGELIGVLCRSTPATPSLRSVAASAQLGVCWKGISRFSEAPRLSRRPCPDASKATPSGSGGGGAL